MALKFQSLLQTPNQGQGRLSGTDQCDVDSLRIISVWKLPFALQKLHVIAVFKSMTCLFAWPVETVMSPQCLEKVEVV